MEKNNGRLQWLIFFQSLNIHQIVSSIKKNGKDNKKINDTKQVEIGKKTEADVHG